MNKTIVTSIICIICIMMLLEANAQSRWYTTTGGETIFSLNSFSDPTSESSVLRFAPVFNSQTLLNNDISGSFGVFTGLALRNVGFIADDPQDASIRKKFRTYNVAIPVGLKIGNLDGTFLYGGFEMEYAFHFKEKTFLNDEKIEKKTFWFNDRVEQWQPSVLVGFQFVKGSNIKFKYYLNTFFNQERTDVYQAEYQRFDGNIFYFSLNSNLFYNTKFIHYK